MPSFLKPLQEGICEHAQAMQQGNLPTHLRQAQVGACGTGQVCHLTTPTVVAATMTEPSTRFVEAEPRHQDDVDGGGRSRLFLGRLALWRLRDSPAVAWKSVDRTHARDAHHPQHIARFACTALRRARCSPPHRLALAGEALAFSSSAETRH